MDAEQFASIRPGDRLLVEVTVQAIPKDTTLDRLYVYCSGKERYFSVPQEDVREILPRPPKPLKVGDKVRMIGGNVPGAVLCVRRDWAWVEWNHEGTVWTAEHRLSDLGRRGDEGRCPRLVRRRSRRPPGK